MKHVKDFIVYNDKTLRYICNEAFCNLNVKKNLSESDYTLLSNWCNNLDSNTLNCCPDGDTGTYTMVSIRGCKPFNCYGSTMQNEAGKISGELSNFFNNVFYVS